VLRQHCSSGRWHHDARACVLWLWLACRSGSGVLVPLAGVPGAVPLDGEWRVEVDDGLESVEMSDVVVEAHGAHGLDASDDVVDGSAHFDPGFLGVSDFQHPVHQHSCCVSAAEPVDVGVFPGT